MPDQVEPAIEQGDGTTFVADMLALKYAQKSQIRGAIAVSQVLVVGVPPPQVRPG